MAQGYYQTAATPKLYVSYPLWLYASGGLEEVTQDFITDPELVEDWNNRAIKMLTLNPSSRVVFYGQGGEEQRSVNIYYRILPIEDTETDVFESKIWNFDYFAILGHDFNTQNCSFKVNAANQEGDTEQLNATPIVNYTTDSVPEFDGWSLVNIDKPSDGTARMLGLEILKSSNNIDVSLGSVMFGKSFEFPINCSLNTTTSFDYGIKQKQTVGGKTISSANWTKTASWLGNEPFGLGPASKTTEITRRSGRRTWTMSFDSLDPKYVMNQNMMTNSNNWTDTDNYTADDSEDSLYNINDRLDFFTTFISKTFANHLPMMLQLDKNSTNPDNFAIVRLNKGYQITQKSPQLYNIKVSFTEQI